MTTKSRQHTRVAKAPALGQGLPLDGAAPLGLFEGRGGDRYLIAADDEYGKFAIVLRHAWRPPFSYVLLGGERVSSGRWWGPYRLRLRHSREPDSGPLRPGGLYVANGGAGLDCSCADHSVRPMPLGHVGEAGMDNRETDSWSIEAARTTFAFCQRASSGALSYGATPLFTTVGWARRDYVELDLRST